MQNIVLYKGPSRRLDGSMMTEVSAILMQHKNVLMYTLQAGRLLSGFFLLTRTREILFHNANMARKGKAEKPKASSQSPTSIVKNGA